MYKTITIMFFMMFLALPCFSALDVEHALIEPHEVIKCLESPEARSLIMDSKLNPFYLRGDFDGDKKIDHAIWARSKTDGTAGIIVCAGNEFVHLLGSGIAGGENFSDMKNDNFFPLLWKIATKQEIDELSKLKCYVPDPFPQIDNESIELLYRAGESTIIYWDGKEYKWTWGYVLEPREGCTIDN